MVGQASPPDIIMTSGDACPTDFLAALKEVIGAFLADSPGEVTLSAKDIAEMMKRHGWDGYKDKWLQTEIGRIINKHELGIYKKTNGKRLYIFERDTGFSDPATKRVTESTKRVTESTKRVTESSDPATKRVTESTKRDTESSERVTESNDKNEQDTSKNVHFNLAESLEEILERKQKQVPDLIEHATAEDYEDVVKAITLVDDKVLREEYLKQLSKKLKLPRKLFKDQVREYLEENKVPYEQPGMEDAGFVDEYNKRFAVLLGSNAGVLNLKQDELVIYNVPEFVNLVTANEIELVCTERGTMRETTKGNLWLRHPRRREYQGIEFLPNGSTAGFYNLWKGFPVKPDASAGKFDHFRELVDELICNGVEYEQGFVWNWMAALIQFPEKKQGTAIAIRGPKGVGKTVFGEVLHMLLGPYYVIADKEEHVSGRFNALLARCLLVHCDEAFFTGNQKAAGTVKSIITGPTNTIERKNKDAVNVKSYTRVLITSEKERICSADEGERRYAVFEMSAKRQNDITFFKGLFDELEAGGIQALMAYLLSLKVQDRLAIPQNDALKRQQIQNLDVIQSYLEYLCSHGILPDVERYWNTKNQATEERITTVEWTEKEGVVIRKDALYQHFVQITPKNHYIPVIAQFFIRLNFILKDDIKQLRPRERDRRYCYWMPPREYMMCRLSETFGINFDEIETKSEPEVNTEPTT